MLAGRRSREPPASIGCSRAGPVGAPFLSNRGESWTARRKLFGHPIHQMLIAFPVGLLATSVVFDLMRAARGIPTWANVAYFVETQ